MLYMRYNIRCNELRIFTDLTSLPPPHSESPHIYKGYITTKPPRDVIRSYAEFQEHYHQMKISAKTIVFYFGGHGSKDSYIFPDGPVHVDNIRSFLLERISPRQNLIVIQDCCEGPIHSLPYYTDDGVIIKRNGKLQRVRGESEMLVVSSTQPGQRAASSDRIGSLFCYFFMAYFDRDSGIESNLSELVTHINSSIQSYDDTLKQSIRIQSNFHLCRSIPPGI